MLKSNFFFFFKLNRMLHKLCKLIGDLVQTKSHPKQNRNIYFGSFLTSAINQLSLFTLWLFKHKITVHTILQYPLSTSLEFISVEHRIKSDLITCFKKQIIWCLLVCFTIPRANKPNDRHCSFIWTYSSGRKKQMYRNNILNVKYINLCKFRNFCDQRWLLINTSKGITHFAFN